MRQAGLLPFLDHARAAQGPEAGADAADARPGEAPPSLHALLARVTPDNVHGPLLDGPARGREEP